MFNQRRKKIAAAVALIMAIGSAAASAGNYANGNGAVPTMEGANAAVDMALEMAGKSTDWMLDRSRKVVSSAFSYSPSAQVRPPEVPYVPPAVPMVERGTIKPVNIDPVPPYGVATNSEAADRARAGSFEAGGGGSGAALSSTIAAAGASGAPANGITAAVPEVEPYAMLLVGLGLIGLVVRRREKSAAV